MKEHFNITIYGKVQGVFFRATARAEAQQLNITGYAKNQGDGSVFIEVEGEKDKLREFITWCKQGSDRAVVDKVLVEKGNLKGFEDFGVAW